MNSMKNDDNYKKKDQKALVITAILVCILLFIAAVGLFFYSYKEYKNENLSQSSKEKAVNMSDSENDSVNSDSDESGDESISKDDDKNKKVKEKIEEKKEITEVSDNELTEGEIQIKNTVKDFLKAVKDMNFEEAYNFTDNNECSLDIVKKQLDTEDNSIVQYNMFFEKVMDFDYVVKDIKADGDKAEADVYIKTYNFTTTVLDARLNVSDIQAAYSIEKGTAKEDEKKLIARTEVKKILDDMDRKLKIPAKISLIKKDGIWKIKAESIDNELRPAVLKNLYDSIQAYNDFYKALNDGEVSVLSVDSFVEYLESKGVYYDEDGDTSPFDEQ